MELPLGGPALRHYTQSRPRPHRQKLNYRPTRPQETIIESENEALEFMGRVDEGVEEFFTKRVLPTEALNTQDEESIIVHKVAPASSVPYPPQTKTLRRKLGDFFTLKKRRGLKSEASQEGRPKKASIADFIRPLREVGRADKDKDRVKEHEKENEKEKAKEHPGSGDAADQETLVSGAPPLRGEAAPPRRALREGKSQSLILLSGSSAAGNTNARNSAKKQFEGQHSFEQKLHLMLQRIGVSKAPPGETQNQEGEMKKAESEGTIIDNKPEALPTFTKPRTMSASSDTRHQIRASVSAHESAGKPALLPKPVLKPGPPPTTSGRNTPENELAEIQEKETNTPPKQSPSAAPCSPVTTSPTLLTISNSVPDSTNFTTSPTSTVLSSDPDICTNFVNSTAAAATTATNATELSNKPSTPEFKATTTELTTSGSPTPVTSPATEFPTTVSLSSAASESITPPLSVTSDPATVTLPSVTTAESVSVPINESPSFTSINLPTKSTFPELNGTVSVDAMLGAAGDTSSVVTTDLFSSASRSDLGGTTSSLTDSSDDVTSFTTSSVNLVSSVIKTTSPPPDVITPESPVISPSSLVSSALLPTSSTCDTTTTTTTSPTSTNVDSVSGSITHTAIPSTADISSPSTSSSETNPTDTTTTTTSLNRADTTSTTSSATAAAISSPLQTDSDPPHPNSISTGPTPAISSLPATVTPHHDSGPAPFSQVSPEEKPCLETAEKGTAGEEFEAIHAVKEMETDESKRVVNVGIESENEKDISVSAESAEILKEVPNVGVKEGVKIELAMAEPPAEDAGELPSDEGIIEDHKQEETKSVHEK